MFSFKNAVISRIDEIFEFAKDKHKLLGPDGYQIAITALLGFTPTNWEIDDVFKNSNGLSLEDLREIVQTKLKYYYVEQYVTELFALFDKDYKGYVTIYDLQKTWNFYKLKLPWGKIEESFRNVAKNNVIDYSDFYEIITDQNFATKALMKYKY